MMAHKPNNRSPDMSWQNHGGREEPQKSVELIAKIDAVFVERRSLDRGPYIA